MSGISFKKKSSCCEASSFNTTRLVIAQGSGDLASHDYHRLTDIDVLSSDGNVIKFQMTEKDRVAAFYMSADYDNVSQFLHVERGAVVDLGLVAMCSDWS